jgi:bla regulator protein blaR1
VKKVLFCLAMSFACLRGADAQTFDVASVRPQSAGDSAFFVRPPNNGGFTAVGATAKLLLMLAYDVQESRIVGGPTWLGTAKWNIEARADSGRQSSAADTQRMLQNLLVERFGLRIHRETTELPVYALSVAKNGPKFKASDHERTNVRVTGRSIDIEYGDIAAMTRVLASALGRPVIDRTGLTALYDLSVAWDDAPVQDGGAFGTAPAPASPNERGSVFTALQEQLGLRLESGRAPVDVIVVDRLETPSPN